MIRLAYIRSDNIYADSRATKEIKALLECGYCVDVFGWDEDPDTPQKCEQIFANGNVHFDFYRGIKSQGSTISKIRAFIKWISFAASRIKKGNYDCIHACDLDCGLIAKISGFPYFYDIYDYFVDSHSFNKILNTIFEHIEIGVINKAETTIICTEERKIQIKNAKPHKVVVIYNSPDLSDMEDSNRNDESEYDYAYCGTLGEGRLIKEIISAHRDNQDLKFIFAGNGSYADLAKKASNESETFIFRGVISYEDVLKIEKNAIAISAIYNPITRNNQLCAPNKFYEALALGKPVIVCKGTGIDRVVEKNKIGVVINYNGEEFYKALRYLKNNPTACKQMGAKGRVLYESSFSWKQSKIKLQNLYSEYLLSIREVG